MKYKVEGGKEYQYYATMSVGNYQLISQGYLPKSLGSTDDVELLYLPDDPGVTLLYPYEEADYLQFYIGWVVVVVSVIFILLGIVAEVIIRRRY